MKITRSYLLGVGSGLMLSVLFAISLPAIGLQDFSQLSKLVGLSKPTSSQTAQPSNQNQPTPQENAISQPSQGLTAGTPDSKGLGSGKSDVSKGNIKTPIVPNNPTVPNTPNPKEPSILTVATQPLEKQFVIPNGVGSERIAELLVSQGLVTNKAQFLETIEKRGVAGKFQVGTFNLSPGLTPDEVLNRLLGKR